MNPNRFNPNFYPSQSALQKLGAIAPDLEQFKTLVANRYAEACNQFVTLEERLRECADDASPARLSSDPTLLRRLAQVFGDYEAFFRELGGIAARGAALSGRVQKGLK